MCCMSQLYPSFILVLMYYEKKETKQGRGRLHKQGQAALVFYKRNQYYQRAPASEHKVAAYRPPYNRCLIPDTGDRKTHQVWPPDMPEE